MRIIIIILVVFLIPNTLILEALAQPRFIDEMISHLRFIHNQLSNNMEETIQLIESNHTAEAKTLLEGMNIRMHHMNNLFNDIVWELSNRGH